MYVNVCMYVYQSYSLQPHLYANDTHADGFCRPGATSSLESRMSDCFSALADGMSCNKLQLNATKTEIQWCKSFRRQHQQPTSQFTVSNYQATPVTSVHDLGSYMDADLSVIHLCKHISSKLLPAALPFCVAQEVFDGPSLNQCYTVTCGGFNAISSRLW